MGKPALVDIALMADALRDIGGILGIPSTVDVLLHLPDLVERVRGLAERAETVRVVTADRDAQAADVDARIADAVAADRMAIGTWLRSSVPSAPFARAIEHGDHIDDDAPPLPSLRMVMLARDELLRQVEALTAERDQLGGGLDNCRVRASGLERQLADVVADHARRIEPVVHARAVLDAYNAGDGDGDYCATMRDLTMDRAGLESVRAALLARVGPEVLAEVER